MCLKSWGRNNYARALIEVSLENILVDSLVVAIPFQNESGHTMETIDIEYEWQPPRLSDDGFVKVTRKHGNGKQTAKTRHIDGVWLTKPKPNYYYRPSSKSANVNKINIVSLQNSFDALMEKDKFFEVSNETWKASNDVGSIMDDSDTKQVKKHMKDNGKPMDGLADDARKKLEAPPKKTPRKIVYSTYSASNRIRGKMVQMDRSLSNLDLGIVLVDGSVPEPSVSQ
ncbi:hypothetical protein Tco_0750292 [Tanacetum coccineum]|uniref:Uncharacterized protein n=1 Tax=Tanacetum coccineum TaxID=301880 RepID=A0ABQ4Z1X0_9ASTR